MYFLPCVTRGLWPWGDDGTPAFSAMGAPAMVLPLMEEPMIADDFFLLDETGHGIGGLDLVALVIDEDKFDLLARMVGFISLPPGSPARNPVRMRPRRPSSAGTRRS